MSFFPAHNSMTSGPAADYGVAHAFASGERGTVRDVVELMVGFALILVALWTPRYWQRWACVAVLLWVLPATVVSFKSWSALGLSTRGFLRSLWVVGVALLLAAAAVVVGSRLHTVQVPDYPGFLVQRFWAYGIFAFLQQFLLLDFFLLRFSRVLSTRTAAVMATAALFALAHVPNPVLIPLTLLWGAVACALFLRYRNLYTLGMAHAIFGICIAVTVPGSADHNMRVGLGYLTYRPHHHRQHYFGPARRDDPTRIPRTYLTQIRQTDLSENPQISLRQIPQSYLVQTPQSYLIQIPQNYLSQIPQTVSTTAWVMDEAPTRRS